MKNLIIVLFLTVFISGCSNDDSDYITIKGRVERDFTGQGISNQKIYLEVRQAKGSGAWAYSVEIDSKEVVTDENGEFSIAMKSASNTYVTAYKHMDENYSTFELASFPIDTDIIIKVDKFIKFKIFVNNTNPFDENDRVLIDFFSGNKQNFRSAIENFGSDNLHYPAENFPGGGGTGAYEVASWTGINVNSIVYYNVPESADTFKIMSTVKKNGVETTSFTNTIPFEIDQINEYHFEY